MKKTLVQMILVLVITLAVVGVVLARPQTGKDCTSSIQAGRVMVQLDENGHSLQTVMLPNAYCGSYVVVVNPQGSGSAAMAEFEVERWFVDSSLFSYAFVLGVEGEGNAGAWFHWVTVASYE